MESSKTDPLHKKGAVSNPGNYRMIGVSGMMYCIHANVLKDLEEQHVHNERVRNILAQAYDTVPRLQLWDHLQRIAMTAPLIRAIKEMDDEYVLVDVD
eukprot:1145069-Pelagomonas_calceolata.AAC.2